MRNLFVVTFLLCTGLVFNSALAQQKTKKMKPIEISSTSHFIEKISDFKEDPTKIYFVGDKPAIVDFYGTWCGPCKQFAPIYAELASLYGDKIDFYKVDVQQQREIADAYRITAIPTLFFITKDGKPSMIEGAPDRESMIKIINDLIK